MNINYFGKFVRSAIDLVFPPQCLICRTFEEEFELPMICRRCWAEIWNPKILASRVASAGEYRPPLSELIQKAKFSSDMVSVRLLGALLESLAERIELPRDTVLTSVPGDADRIRARGIDLPHFLARAAAQRCRFLFDPDLLVRRRKIPTQTSLDRAKRLENLEGAFEAHESCREKNICVVDDVVTTGATAHEITEVLQRVGAKSVTLIAVARTPLGEGQT